VHQLNPIDHACRGGKSVPRAWETGTATPSHNPSSRALAAACSIARQLNASTLEIEAELAASESPWDAEAGEPGCLDWQRSQGGSLPTQYHATAPRDEGVHAAHPTCPAPQSPRSPHASECQPGPCQQGSGGAEVHRAECSVADGLMASVGGVPAGSAGMVPRPDSKTHLEEGPGGAHDLPVGGAARQSSLHSACSPRSGPDYAASGSHHASQRVRHLQDEHRSCSLISSMSFNLVEDAPDMSSESGVGSPAAPGGSGSRRLSATPPRGSIRQAPSEATLLSNEAGGGLSEGLLAGPVAVPGQLQEGDAGHAQQTACSRRAAQSPCTPPRGAAAAAWGGGSSAGSRPWDAERRPDGGQEQHAQGSKAATKKKRWWHIFRKAEDAGLG
jgi:hypothetical protein